MLWFPRDVVNTPFPLIKILVTPLRWVCRSLTNANWTARSLTAVSLSLWTCGLQINLRPSVILRAQFMCRPVIIKPAPRRSQSLETLVAVQRGRLKSSRKTLASILRMQAPLLPKRGIFLHPFPKSWRRNSVLFSPVPSLPSMLKPKGNA